MNREQELEQLMQEIVIYCLRWKMNGSFNNRYKDFLVSFEIKEKE